jgi:hypothetical protein
VQGFKPPVPRPELSLRKGSAFEPPVPLLRNMPYEAREGAGNQYGTTASTYQKAARRWAESRGIGFLTDTLKNENHQEVGVLMVFVAPDDERLDARKRKSLQEYIEKQGWDGPQWPTNPEDTGDSGDVNAATEPEVEGEGAELPRSPLEREDGRMGY